VFLLHGFFSVEFITKLSVVFGEFGHEGVVVDVSRWDVFVFEIGVWVGVEVVVDDVWRHPRVVLIVRVVRDLLTHVWLLEALDAGDDRLELLAKAFQLFFHAVLHELHHVG
jgi:hypothetical protein